MKGKINHSHILEFKVFTRRTGIYVPVGWS